MEAVLFVLILVGLVVGGWLVIHLSSPRSPGEADDFGHVDRPQTTDRPAGPDAEAQGVRAPGQIVPDSSQSD